MHLFASTPGRICLFGEHQDYPGLPGIAAASSRRVHMSAHSVPQSGLRLGLPGVGDWDDTPFEGRYLS